MPQFTWAFDAPTGTYKNHKLSQELFSAAVADSIFMDHVQPQEEFGKGMGESITLKRVSNISEPTSADLTEGIRIPEDQLSLSTKAITVGEIGRAVPFS